MKKVVALCVAACLLFGGCSISAAPENQGTNPPYVQTNPVTAEVSDDAVRIQLSDEGVTVNGEAVSTDPAAAVYTARDIVFYLEGQGFTYGEGTEGDAHAQEEADAHTVVHITKPGQYILSGSLSAGQIAVDLGEDAKDDPNAVVTLVLDNVNVTCTVAPAVIFYNVYECGIADEDSATMDVDTSRAGANVIIADGSENNIHGSYVARIYKSVELNEDGTKVVDSKKLHKYDAAFYSKMSMNIYGEENSTGKLNIYAENEGLDSELHLTLYSGNIHIESGNDGINTNEDNVSVTRIAGGTLDVVVNGVTGEGDGIDSNGWLVIDGGVVTASACGFSGDAGIDADKGVYLRGGTVVASGNMLDRVQGEQTHAVFTFGQKQTGGKEYTLKTEAGTTVLTCTPANDFQYLIVSSGALTAGNYTFWQGDKQLSAGQGGGMGGIRPEGGLLQKPEGERPSMPAGEVPTFPEGQAPGFPQGQPPEKPEGERPDGQPGQMPGGVGGAPGQGTAGQATQILKIVAGANYFQIF